LTALRSAAFVFTLAPATDGIVCSPRLGWWPPEEAPLQTACGGYAAGAGEEAMLAARTILRALFLILAIYLIGGIPTYSQSTAFLNTSKIPRNRTGSEAWLAKCEVSSTNSLATLRLTEGSETSPIINETGDSNAQVPPAKVCLDAPLATPTRTLADNPCRQDGIGIQGVPHLLPCNEAQDTVSAELSALGKAGLKIARAREEVLDILRSNNTCAEWFETKEANAAATFQSLNFFLDRQGPQDIFESMDKESNLVRRQPYVARATQDGGAHTAIMINSNGAFYRPQGQLLRVGQESGPIRPEGMRILTVGNYRGDTLPAQVTTLLHELGHIIDLLPEDADNLDGKSVHNTDEVLRHCRTEVEARALQARQTGKQ